MGRPKKQEGITIDLSKMSDMVTEAMNEAQSKAIIDLYVKYKKLKFGLIALLVYMILQNIYLLLK